VQVHIPFQSYDRPTLRVALRVHYARQLTARLIVSSQRWLHPSLYGTSISDTPLSPWLVMEAERMITVDPWEKAADCERALQAAVAE
jgi:hypothetical protein